MKKASIYLLIVLLVFTMGSSPAQIFAKDSTKDEEQDALLLTDKENEEVDVFESEKKIKLDTPVDSVSDNTEALVLKEQDSVEINKKSYLYVAYESEGEESEEKEGYVLKDNVIDIDDADNYKEKRSSENKSEENADNEENNNEENNDEEANSEENADNEENNDEEANSEENADNEENNDEETNSEENADKEENGEEDEETVTPFRSATDGVSSEAQTGVAKKSPTNVREKTSTKSNIIKRFYIGEVFEYKPYNDNWNEVKVDIDGKTKTGYIHKKHFTNVKTKPQDKKGVAKKAKTNVRAGASTKSKVIKSYSIGSALDYESFSKNWNQIKVKVDGKTETGYIHKKHVTDVNTKPEAQKGVAKKAKTNVRAGASTKSKVIKSYSIGSALDYESFSKNWNQIKVKVNGKTETGYIHNKHVTDVTTTPQKKQVVAEKSPTNIRAGASTESKVIDKVSEGKLIDVSTFSKNWYTFETKVDGETITGYVHRKHVNKDTDKEKLYGFSGEKGASVYTDTSKNSKALKTYKGGKLLKYQTHNENWYKATVKINGKSKTGFIPKSEILQSKGSVVLVDPGHGGSDNGASANGLIEKNINLELGLDLEKKLKNSGFDVIMTRTTDTTVSLEERSSMANKKDPDIYVSIHANSFNGSAEGIETYWYDGHEPKESNLLANTLQNELIKNTNANDRRAQEKNLHVNRETYMPSSLVEVGFVDNKQEAEKLKKSSYKKTLVESMLNGIKSFFKI